MMYRVNRYLLASIFFLISFRIASAKDLWDDLTQISFSAVTANLIGTAKLFMNEDRTSDQYKIFFKNDFGDLRIKIIVLGQNSAELIKTDFNVNFYSDSIEGILKAHLFNFIRYPNFLPQNPIILKNAYHLELGESDQIANRKCQWYWLHPKNENLYSVGFCADKKNYFPLTYAYRDNLEEKDVVRLAFQNIAYVKPTETQLKLIKNYSIANSTDHPMAFSEKIKDSSQIDDKRIISFPKDFYIISEKISDNQSYSYYYLSNGLAYVSFFICSAEDGKTIQALLKQSRAQVKRAHIHGPINQIEYTDSMYQIILIGDMPFAALENFILNTKLKY